MTSPGVYILQSLRNGRYYTGSTDDMDRRFVQHDSGKVLATQGIRPLEVRVFIPCQDLVEARKFEYRLKRYKSRVVLEKVIRDRKFPWVHLERP